MNDCCETQAGRYTCPECGMEGMAVKKRTVRSLIRDRFQGEIIDKEGYCFCRNERCHIVYFLEGLSLTKDKLRVRVGLKELEPPFPVCYCFDITKEDIEEEIREKGFSTASERIREEVRKGNCSCEIKNPTGRCCLKDVTKVEEGLGGVRYGTL